MSTAVTSPLPPAEVEYVQQGLAYRTEVDALREDNAHLLRTARQAGTALAHERARADRMDNRIGAAITYVNTMRTSHRQRRELLALLCGHREQD